MPELDVLYEDNHLLVINKPAGMATMGAESGPTAYAMAAAYLRQKYHKPGRVYVGVVSRLDAMTSGVLVLARTSKAAKRLAAQFAAGAEPQPSTKGAIKIYLAAVEGRLESPRGQWSDYVRKDDRAHRMRVVDRGAEGARLARLRYQVVSESRDVSIVAVELLTGRKHQIRLQFAQHGHPIIGDRKYGSQRKFPAGVALHSWRLQIMHPTRREPVWFEVDTPTTWKPYQRLMPGRHQLRALLADSFDLPREHP